MSGIVRVNKNTDYFSASNEPFNDSRLRWETRGVLAYLLSKPDGWECRNFDLINQGPAGRDKIEGILKELKIHGYMTRTKKQKPDGTIQWETSVYESPDLNPDFNPSIPGKSVDGSTIPGLTVDGSAINGKPVDIVSTESLSTESLNTNKETTTEDLDNFQILFTQHFGKLSHKKTDPLRCDVMATIKEYGLEVVTSAIFTATVDRANGTPRTWGYVKGILNKPDSKGANHNDSASTNTKSRIPASSLVGWEDD